MSRSVRKLRRKMIMKSGMGGYPFRALFHPLHQYCTTTAPKKGWFLTKNKGLHFYKPL